MGRSPGAPACSDWLVDPLLTSLCSGRLGWACVSCCWQSSCSLPTVPRCFPRAWPQCSSHPSVERPVPGPPSTGVLFSPFFSSSLNSRVHSMRTLLCHSFTNVLSVPALLSSCHTQLDKSLFPVNPTHLLASLCPQPSSSVFLEKNGIKSQTPVSVSVWSPREHLAPPTVL